ncbi:MAG TPA: hypothetical protein P5165_08665 [Spirochaetia bacterium]|nr:hypothetical protein [Spirochaetales bacterium]HRY73283.1 hypothetical protein [Spirochaetia bacterium]
MKFESTRRGGQALPFREAVLRGYPADGGLFMPAGEADLRYAVYSPAASFQETIALAAGALFPEELDPLKAAAVADLAFASEPSAFAYGEDLLVLDLARGPSASAADYGAAFAAAITGDLLAAPGVAVAAAEGREAAALAAAFAGPKGQASRRGAAPLVLLCPEEGLRGLPPSIRGGGVILLGVKGGPEAASLLERRASGGRLGAASLIPLGAGTPARLAGRALLLVGLFALARRGLSGDLLVSAPPSDGFGLATGLWAWSWGLPVSAFVVARPPSAPRLPGDSLAGFGLDPMAEELLAPFARDCPLGSLALLVDVEAGAARREAAALAASGGPGLDAGSALGLAAARRALAAGFGGHARIVVPRFADPSWDAPPSGAAEEKAEGALAGAAGGQPGGAELLEPDALVEPDLDSLVHALSRLL